MGNEVNWGGALNKSHLYFVFLVSFFSIAAFFQNCSGYQAEDVALLVEVPETHPQDGNSTEAGAFQEPGPPPNADLIDSPQAKPKTFDSCLGKSILTPNKGLLTKAIYSSVTGPYSKEATVNTNFKISDTKQYTHPTFIFGEQVIGSQFSFSIRLNIDWNFIKSQIRQQKGDPTQTKAVLFRGAFSSYDQGNDRIQPGESVSLSLQPGDFTNAVKVQIDESPQDKWYFLLIEMESVDYLYFNYKTDHYKYYASYTSAVPADITSAPLRRAVDIQNYYLTENELKDGKFNGGSVSKFFGPDSVWVKSGLVNESYFECLSGVIYGGY